MFTTTYLIVMKYFFKSVWLPALLFFTVPLTAQFRSEMRTAEKELELFAFHSAIESYKRALTYRRNNTDAKAALGYAYRMINELDTARMYYEGAMADRRVTPETLLGYAQTLRSLGRYDEARTLFLAYAREADQTIGNHYATSCGFARSQQSVNAGFRIDALGMNSAASDFGPSVPQADKLVFNSSRAGEGSFDGTAGNQPYVADIGTDGVPGSPVAVTFGYTSQNGSVGPVNYSPDGTQVIFTRNNFTTGTRMVPEAGITLNLFIADVNLAGRWTNVRPLPFNTPGASTGFGTFSQDGQTIYFSSDRSGGFGGFDLYRARHDGIQWTAVPENLGRVVNSAGHEITPFFDGNSLYFSSDWHHGLGAYDVFRADMQDFAPVTLYHMGGAVNSPRDDYGFTYDRNRGRGYLTSNRADGSRVDENIYLVSSLQLPTSPTTGPVGEDPVGAPPTGVPDGVSPNEPVPFGMVRGYVTDGRTNQPISDASVRIMRRRDGKELLSRTDVNGAYFVSVDPFTTYEVSVTVPGYENVTFPVNTDGGTKRDIFGNVTLLPGRTTGEPVTPPGPTIDPAAGSGYAIQIASLGSSPDLGRYDNLKTVGRVYSVATDGMHKVRVGGFSTREAATAAVPRARDLGYQGSFVVADMVSKGPDATTASPATDVANPGAARYRVQLGAFSKPENFDRAKAGQLGTLGSEMRGVLTVFFIDALGTLQDAESVRQRAEGLGYSGAYILSRTGAGYQKL